ncbi:hypothetical protein [Paracoccus actinidiae]|jgi:hypothetical protein|nr:hypothetical protein [Paracoccus sp. M09]
MVILASDLFGAMRAKLDQQEIRQFAPNKDDVGQHRMLPCLR